MRRFLGAGMVGGALVALAAAASEQPTPEPPVDARLAVVEPECADGAWCAPIPIAALDGVAEGDTARGERLVDRYGCDPEVDEGGGEIVYELALDAPTWVRAAVEGEPGSDPDLHLLSGVGPSGCRARGDSRISAVLPAGTWWLVVDAWSAREGRFQLSVVQEAVPGGRCAMVPRDQVMYWPDCAEGIDCAATDAGVIARLPAAGPVAKEAHLRTVADAAWPTSGDDALEAHYRASRYAMHRKEPWAPSPTGETWAVPSYGRPLPVDAETWYVNMFWREKPFPGERMIVWNPRNGRAVVAAAGYETGPRSNASLGGASEEVHHALGTRHHDELVLGFAADQSLPYGPVACE